MPSSAPRLRATPDHSPRLSTGITLAIIVNQAGVAMPLDAAEVARSRKKSARVSAGADPAHHNTATPIAR